MALDQFLGALSGGDSNNSNQGSGAQDPLAGLLGGLLGGQSGGQQGEMSQLLGGLLGGQTGGQQDGMSQLLGGLLGGQTQGQQAGQTGQIGSALGMLEGLMGSGGVGAANQGGSAAANDPVMQMLTPLVDSLAAKMKIPPAIAVVVVSFVVHQLLSSHPASGRTSLVDVGQLQQQMSSGQGVSRDYLHSSGLVSQLVQQTGLDTKVAAKSLKTVFDMLGQN